MFSFIKIQSKIINLSNIGPVLFEQSNRAKHLNISVKPLAIIRVAVPIGISFEMAVIFARRKEGWIKKTLNKVKLRSTITANLNSDEMAHAKIYILGRLKELAQQHGFTYNKATVRNQKTRWGSCSVKNNISLNMQLMKLPNELIDSAQIDGANHIQIFFKIALPLSKSALAALGIIIFNNVWNNFFYPYIFLNDMNNYTLPLGLALLSGNPGSFSEDKDVILMAAVGFAVLPVLIVFIIGQRWIVEAFTKSGLKG